MQASEVDIEGQITHELLQNMCQMLQPALSPESQIIVEQVSFLLNKLKVIDLQLQFSDILKIAKPADSQKLFDWVYDFSQIIIHPSNEKPYLLLMQNIEPTIGAFLFIPELCVLRSDSQVAGFQQFFEKKAVPQK